MNQRQRRVPKLNNFDQGLNNGLIILVSTTNTILLNKLNILAKNKYF